MPHLHVKVHKNSHKEEKARDFGLELSSLTQNSSKIPLKNYLDRLTNLTKDYLKVKHNIKQEFTFEELKDFKNISKTESQLADKIIGLKFGGIELTRKNVDEISNLARNIIKFIPTQQEEHKVGFFTRLFKRKDKLEIKHPNLELPEAPKLSIKELSKITPIPIILPSPRNIEVKPKKQRLGLFFNFKKRKILRLMNEATILINKNPLKSKRTFGLALLRYNKLRIINDLDIHNRLNMFMRDYLKEHKHEKHFLDLSRKIMELKHKGKQLSFESLNTIRNLRELIKSEEKLVKVRLNNFSTKLKLEEQKLKHSKPERRISVSNVLSDLPEAPKQISNEELINRKNTILNLLERAYSKLEKDPEVAKRYYGEALLNYYDLPVKQESLVYSKIMRFHNAMLKFHGKKHKSLIDLAKEIIHTKHTGKESPELINKFNINIKQSKMEFPSAPKLNIKDLRLEAPVHIKGVMPKLELPKAPRLYIKDLDKLTPEPIRVKPSLESEYPKYNYDVELVNKMKEDYKKEEERTNVKVTQVSNKEKEDINKLIKLSKGYKENYLSRTYVTAGLPKYTKLKQFKKILPMPYVQLVEKPRESKRLIEIRKEEQEIYNKLQKLN